MLQTAFGILLISVTASTVHGKSRAAIMLYTAKTVCYSISPFFQLESHAQLRVK